MKKRTISLVAACLVNLLFLLVYFNETQGNVVALKELIKPQDVEYDVRVEFAGKLTEREIKKEITKLEEKYKLKVVRRANGRVVEFRLKEKGDAGKVTAQIKKENKSVAKADVNPLLTEFAWQKVEKNKLKVTYKKHVKEYQKKYLENFYKLKPVERATGVSDSSVEQEYEVSKIPLLKVYNGLRKVGAIKTVRFVGGEKIAEVPQNGEITQKSNMDFKDPEVKKKVIAYAQKRFGGQPLTKEDQEFYENIKQRVNVTGDIKKKYPELVPLLGEQYLSNFISVYFTRKLTQQEIEAFEKKYELIAFYTSPFEWSSSRYRSIIFIISNPDKTAINLYYEISKSKDPLIIEVSFLGPIKKLTSPPRFTYNDQYFPQQWHLLQDNNATASNFDINAPEAWNVTRNLASETIIAVIELYPFGDVDHDDLKNKIYKDSSGNIIGWNFKDDMNNFSNNTSNYWFHGTEVMGVVAAETGNTIGVAGVAANSSIKIMPITFDKDLRPQLKDAIDFAVENGADVINMSFAGGTALNLQVNRDAVTQASDSVILVAAAGNSNSQLAEYPADFPEVIKVAATQKDGKRWFDRFDQAGEDGGSNYGAKTDLSAPGKEIVTTFWNSSQPTTHNLYTSSSPHSGTSVASPIVAGVAALVLSKYPSFTPDQVKRVLYGAVNDVDGKITDGSVSGGQPQPGKDDLGYGRIDAFKAVAPPRVRRVTVQRGDTTKVFDDGDLDGDSILNFTDEDIDGDEFVNGADQNDDGNNALDGAQVDTNFDGSADAVDDDGDNIPDGTNKASDIEASTYKIPGAGDLKLFVQFNETMYWDDTKQAAGDILGAAGGVDPTAKLIGTDGSEIAVKGTDEGGYSDWSTKEVEKDLWAGKVSLSESDLDQLVGDVRVKISGSSDMAGEELDYDPTTTNKDAYEYTLTVPAFRPSPDYPGSSVKRGTQVGEGNVALVGGVIDVYGRNFNTNALTMKMEIYNESVMVGQAVTMNKTTAFEFKGTWDTGTLKTNGTREYPNGKYKVTLKAYDGTSATPVMMFSREVRVENDFAIKNVSAANKSTYSFSLTSADPNLEIKYTLTRQAKIDMEVYGSNSDKSFTTEQVTDLVAGTNGDDCAEKPQGENQTQDWNNAFLTSQIPAAYRKSDLWVEVRDCDTGQKIESNKFRLGDAGIDDFAVLPLRIQPTVLGSNKADIQFNLRHAAKVSIKVYKESLVKSGSTSPIKVILQTADPLATGQYKNTYFWDGTADAGYTCPGSSYVCDADYDYYIVVEEIGAESSSAKKAYVNVSGISGTPPPAPSCNSFTLSNVSVYPYILQPQVAGYSDPEGYKDTVTISYDLQGGSNSCIHQVKMYVWQSHSLLWEWKADFNHLIGGDEATYEYGGPGDEINDNKVIWDGQICYVGEEFEYLPWPHPVQKWKCDKQIPSSQYYFQLAAYDSNGYRVAVSDVETIRVITPAVNLKLRTLTPGAIEKAILASNGSVPERIDIYENIVHEATLLREFYNPKEMQYIWDGRDNKAQNYVINPGNTYVPILYVPYPSKAQIPVPYMYCEGAQCPVPALSDVGFTQSTSGGYTIQYRAAGRAIPTVEILDAAKQNVLKRFTTPDQPFTSGEKTIAWDGKDDKGVLLSKVEGLVLRIDLDNLYGYARVEKVIPSDIIPPVITHTPTQVAQEGTDITFTATVTDNVSVQKASLWYGYAGGTSPFQEISMSQNGNTFTAFLAGTNVGSADIKYYLKAEDASGNFTKTETFSISTYSPDRQITFPLVSETLEPLQAKTYFEWLAVGTSAAGHQDQLLTLSSQSGNDDVRLFGYDSNNFVFFGNIYDDYKNYFEGVSVTSGDFDGDGKDELALSSDSTNDDVRVFKYAKGKFEGFGQVYDNYAGYNWGVNVTSGDFDGNGKDELVLSALKANDDVRIFKYQNGKFTLLAQIYDEYGSYADGLNAASGDFDGDGKDELVLSSISGNDDVRIFKYESGNFVRTGNLYDAYQNYNDGVHVASGDFDGDGKDELVLSSQSGNDDVRVFSVQGNSFTAFATVYDNYVNYADGVNVTSGDFDGNGSDELVLSSRSGNDDVRVFRYESGGFTWFGSVYDNYPNYFDGVYVTSGDFDVSIARNVEENIMFNEVRTINANTYTDSGFPSQWKVKSPFYPSLGSALGEKHPDIFFDNESYGQTGYTRQTDSKGNLVVSSNGLFKARVVDNKGKMFVKIQGTLQNIGLPKNYILDYSANKGIAWNTIEDVYFVQPISNQALAYWDIAGLQGEYLLRLRLDGEEVHRIPVQIGDKISPSGGIAKSPYGQVKIEFSPETVQDTHFVAVWPRQDVALPQGLSPTSDIYEVKPALTENDFLSPAQMTFYWEDKNNDGLVDGTSTDERTVAIYRFVPPSTLQQLPTLARDEGNNFITAEVEHFSFFVLLQDHTAPGITSISVFSSPFSPNGDGKKEAASIGFFLSEGAQVTVKALSGSGTVVRTFLSEQRERGFQSVTWDGKNDGGNVVPDGTYTIQIEAQDVTGNKGTASASVVVDTTRPIASFAQVNPQAFSPNNDGIADTVIFSYTLSESGYVTANILNSANNTVFRFFLTPNLQLPQMQTVTWDGTGNTGEDLYTMYVRVEDLAGNASDVVGKDVLLDLGPPIKDFSDAPDPFSPDRDGVADATMLRFTMLWTADVTVSIIGGPENINKTLLSATRKTGGTPVSVTWDGLETSTKPYRSGTYTFVINLTDLAGHTRRIEEPVELLLGPPEIQNLTATALYVSPNNDKVKDATTISYTLSKKATVTAKLYNSKGEFVRTFTNAILPAGQKTILWDGKIGTKIIQGSYILKVDAVDPLGNKAAQKTLALAVDITVPQIKSLAANPTAFSPNHDGKKDETTLTYELSENVITSGKILSSSGALANLIVPGVLKSQGINTVTWDGEGAAGDGSYTVVFSAEDLAGNKSQTKNVALTLDTIAPSLTDFVAAPEAFSPNGDGLEDTAQISFKTNEPLDVLLTVDTLEGITVKTFESMLTSGTDFTKTVSFIWNGEDTNNTLAPEGFYNARVTLTDTAANETNGGIRVVLSLIRFGEIFVTNIGHRSATVQFTTTPESIAQIQYTGPAAGQTLLTPEEAEFTANHDIPLTGLLPGQTVAFTIFARNQLGARGFSNTKLFYTVPPPALAFYIEEKPAPLFTNKRDAALLLEASVDSPYAVTSVRFHNEDTPLFGDYETFSTQKVWTLSPGDGRKTVFAQVRDNDNEESPVAVSEIILDTTPPTKPEIHATRQEMPKILVNMSSTDNFGVSHFILYRAIEEITEENKAQSTVINNKSPGSFMDNTGKPGTTYFYASQAVDLAGNVSELSENSSERVDTIFDGVMINDGQECTTTRDVDLTLHATAAEGFEIKGMQLSTDNATFLAIEPYVTPRAWELSEGDGHKFVYAKFVDNVDKDTVTYKDFIIYDTTPPTPATLSAIGDALQRRIEINWTQSTDLCGVKEYRLYRNVVPITEETKENAKVIATLGPFAASYVDTDVFYGVTYHYAIETEDKLGFTALSNSERASISCESPLQSVSIESFSNRAALRLGDKVKITVKVRNELLPLSLQAPLYVSLVNADDPYNPKSVLPLGFSSFPYEAPDIIAGALGYQLGITVEEFNNAGPVLLYTTKDLAGINASRIAALVWPGSPEECRFSHLSQNTFPVEGEGALKTLVLSPDPAMVATATTQVFTAKGYDGNGAEVPVDLSFPTEAFGTFLKQIKTNAGWLEPLSANTFTLHAQATPSQGGLLDTSWQLVSTDTFTHTVNDMEFPDHLVLQSDALSSNPGLFLQPIDLRRKTVIESHFTADGDTMDTGASSFSTPGIALILGENLDQVSDFNTLQGKQNVLLFGALSGKKASVSAPDISGILDATPVDLSQLHHYKMVVHPLGEVQFSKLTDASGISPVITDTATYMFISGHVIYTRPRDSAVFYPFDTIELPEGFGLLTAKLSPSGNYVAYTAERCDVLGTNQMCLQKTFRNFIKAIPGGKTISFDASALSYYWFGSRLTYTTLSPDGTKRVYYQIALPDEPPQKVCETPTGETGCGSFDPPEQTVPPVLPSQGFSSVGGVFTSSDGCHILFFSGGLWLANTCDPEVELFMDNMETPLATAHLTFAIPGFSIEDGMPSGGVPPVQVGLYVNGKLHARVDDFRISSPETFYSSLQYPSQNPQCSENTFFTAACSGNFNDDFLSDLWVKARDGAVEGIARIKIVPDTEPPTEVLDLQASLGQRMEVDLTWSEAADNFGVSKYILYRHQEGITEDNKKFAFKLAEIPYEENGEKVTFYTDGITQQGEAYYYVLEAVDTSGNTTLSNNANITVPEFKITDLQAATTQTIELTWTEPPAKADLDTYQIYRNTQAFTDTVNEGALVFSEDFSSGMLDENIFRMLIDPMQMQVTADKGLLEIKRYAETATIGGAVIVILNKRYPVTDRIVFEIDQRARAKGGDFAFGFNYVTSPDGILSGQNVQAGFIVSGSELNVAAPDGTLIPVATLGPDSLHRYKVAYTKQGGHLEWYLDGQKILEADGISFDEVTLVFGAGGPEGMYATFDNIHVYQGERTALTPLGEISGTQTNFFDDEIATNTTYYYGVTATDSTGRVSLLSNVASAMKEGERDTVPPTAITDLQAVLLNTEPNQAQLTWSGATDNVGVIRYKVLRIENEQITDANKLLATILTNTLTSNTRNYLDETVEAGKTYYYAVTSFDAAGNESTLSNSPNVIIPSGQVDTVAPMISNVVPPDNTFVNSIMPLISATVTDADSGVNSQKVFVKVDETLLPSTYDELTQKVTVTFLESQSVGEGPHTLKITAMDNAGNTATSTTMFTVDVNAPLVVITNPLDGSFVSTKQFNVTATLTDNASGIDPSTTVLKADGISCPYTYDETTGTLTYAWPPDIQDGVHEVTIDVKDRAGNSAVQAKSTFTVDTIVPQVNNVSDTPDPFSPGNSFGVKDANTITATVSDSNVDTWSLSLTSPQNTTVASTNGTGTDISYLWSGTDTTGAAVQDGLYNYVITAKDKAGNTSGGAQLTEQTVLQDNFDGTNIDTSKWTVANQDNGLSVTQSGGKLKISGQPTQSGGSPIGNGVASYASADSSKNFTLTFDVDLSASQVSAGASVSANVVVGNPGLGSTALLQYYYHPSAQYEVRFFNQSYPLTYPYGTISLSYNASEKKLSLFCNGQKKTDVNVELTDGVFSFLAAGGGTQDIIDVRYDNFVLKQETVTGGTTSGTITVDNTNPVAALEILGPQFAQNGNLFISGNTQLTIQGNDPVVNGVSAGIEKSEYAIDQQESPQPYTAPFTLQEGPHTVRYSALDNAGNESAQTFTQLVVDATPPVTNISPAPQAFTKTKTFTLSATDPQSFGMASGVQQILVALDGAPFATYVSGLTLNDGYHTVEYFAIDNVGNEEQHHIMTFTVDTTKPEVANISDTPDPFSPGASSGIKDTNTISASVNDVNPDTWKLQLFDAANNPAQNFSGSGSFITQLWNGTLSTGGIAPDGLYSYSLLATDKAGNTNKEVSGGTTETKILLQDDFNDNYLDPIKWNTSALPSDPGLTVTEEEGQLRVSGTVTAANPGEQVSGVVSNVFGDVTKKLNVSVDVDLTRAQSSASEGKTVFSLVLLGNPSADALITFYVTFDAGNYQLFYQTFSGQQAFAGTVPATGKITLNYDPAASMITGYFNDEQKAQVPISIQDFALTVLAATGSQGTPVDVRFDNFLFTEEGSSSGGGSNVQVTDNFDDGQIDMNAWDTQSYRGHNRYTLEEKEGVLVFSASGDSFDPEFVGIRKTVSASKDFTLSVQVDLSESVAQSTEVSPPFTGPVAIVGVGDSLKFYAGVVSQQQTQAYRLYAFSPEQGFLQLSDLPTGVGRMAFSYTAQTRNLSIAFNGAPAGDLTTTFTGDALTALLGAAKNPGDVMVVKFDNFSLTQGDGGGGGGEPVPSMPEGFITVDNTLPISTLTPSVSLFNNQYAPTSAAYALTADDPVVNGANAGIEKIEVSKDNEAFVAFTSALSLDEGKHMLQHKATDNAGNMEDVKTFAVDVDGTSPVTQLAPSSPLFNSLYTPISTTYTLSAADPVSHEVSSGVLKTVYKIDGGAETQYSNAISLTEGEHTITYFSKDNVLNTEAEKTFTVRVDNTAPVTQVVPSVPLFANQYAPVSTIYTFSANDPASFGVASGVSKIEYTLDGGVTNTYTGNPISLTEGVHTFVFYATDNVGNVEAQKTFVVHMDNTPPVTTASAGDPKYSTADKQYVAANTPITLNATDPTVAGVSSGVSSTQYKIDSGNYANYTGAFTLSEGIHTVAFRSTDNVANVENEKTQTFHVDATPPTAEISFSATNCTDNGKTVVSGQTQFMLTGSDPVVSDVSSGVKELRYRVNGGTWQSYTAAFTLLGLAQDGEVTIEFVALDNVENTSTAQSISVVLDATPPVAQILSPQDKTVVNNTIAVMGTVTETHFANSSYILQYGAGQNPQNFTDIATSAVQNTCTAQSASCEPLAYWNTSALTQNALYTLRLTATDCVGNIATAQQLLRVGTPEFAGSFGTHSGGGNNANDGEFNQPTGLVAMLDDTNAERVLVSDKLNARVQTFSDTGQFVSKFTDSLKKPTELALDGAKNIYIVDSQNDRVVKLDKNYNVLASFGTHGAGVGQFNKPYGIALDASGNMYVTDKENNRVQKLDTNGIALKEWTGVKQIVNGVETTLAFSAPSGISVDAQGNLFVADAANNRILKFTQDGVLLRILEATGVTQAPVPDGSTPFALLLGLMLDASNNLYVADSQNHRVQKFDPWGNRLLNFGTQGSGNNPPDGAFHETSDIALDTTSKFMYVTDVKNDRIQKFAVVIDAPVIAKLASTKNEDKNAIITDPNLLNVLKVVPFPTPSRGKLSFNLEAEGNVTQITLEVYTINGKRVLTEFLPVQAAPASKGKGKFKAESPSLDAVLSSLPNGVYVYRLQISNGVKTVNKTGKFVVVK